MRTPLSSIYTIIEVFERSTALKALLDLEGTESIDTMKEAATSISDTLNGVLCLQQIEEGNLVVKSEPFSIATSIQSVVATFNSELIKRGGMKIFFKFPKGAPIVIEGDKDRFSEVVSVLVGNAVKHSVDGSSIRIGISFSSQQINLVDIHGVTVTVEDDGEGISEAHQETIFGAFVHERPASLKTGQGPGLSLAVCHGLVRLQGGNITVKSALGKGSTFTVFIPFSRRPQNFASSTEIASSVEEVIETKIAPVTFISALLTGNNLQNRVVPEKSQCLPDEDRLVEASPFTKRPGGQVIVVKSSFSESTQPTRKTTEMKVLVVDDSATYRKTMGMLLKREGIDFDMAEDGQDCLNKALGRAVDYDIIFMDNLMPESKQMVHPNMRSLCVLTCSFTFENINFNTLKWTESRLRGDCARPVIRT